MSLRQKSPHPGVPAALPPCQVPAGEGGVGVGAGACWGSGLGPTRGWVSLGVGTEAHWRSASSEVEAPPHNVAPLTSPRPPLLPPRTTHRWPARWPSARSTPGTGCPRASCRATSPPALTSARPTSPTVQHGPPPLTSPVAVLSCALHPPTVPSVPTDMDRSLGKRMKQPEVPTAWQPPPCQEDWDAGECPAGC